MKKDGEKDIQKIEMAYFLGFEQVCMETKKTSLEKVDAYCLA